MKRILNLCYLKKFQDKTRSKKALIETVKRNRVSHAQMFLGPEGSGKLALAIAYAQYINCHNKTDKDSCGVCPSCVKYNKLAHPDLHFVFPKVAVKEEEESKKQKWDPEKK